jgi:hypothetical protein
LLNVPKSKPILEPLRYSALFTVRLPRYRQNKHFCTYAKNMQMDFKRQFAYINKTILFLCSLKNCIRDAA